MIDSTTMDEVLKIALTQAGLGLVSALLLYLNREIWKEYKAKDEQIKVEVDKREKLIHQHLAMVNLFEDMHQVLIVVSKDLNEILIRVRMDPKP